MNASDPIGNSPETSANPASAAGDAAGAVTKAESIKLKHLARLLNVTARWRILRELAKGEALPVNVLAVRVRCPAASVSKHMALLKKAGVVTIGYGRLYKLSPAVQPQPGSPRLDLGHCVIKLDTEW